MFQCRLLSYRTSPGFYKRIVYSAGCSHTELFTVQTALLHNCLQCRLLSYTKIFYSAGCSPTELFAMQAALLQICLQCRLLSYTELFTVQAALQYRIVYSADCSIQDICWSGYYQPQDICWSGYYQPHSSVNGRCQQFVNKLIANINCNGSLSSCLGTITTLYNSFATFWQKVGVRNRDTKIISVMLRLRK